MPIECAYPLEDGTLGFSTSTDGQTWVSTTVAPGMIDPNCRPEVLIWKGSRYVFYSDKGAFWYVKDDSVPQTVMDYFLPTPRPVGIIDNPTSILSLSPNDNSERLHVIFNPPEGEVALFSADEGAALSFDHLTGYFNCFSPRYHPALPQRVFFYQGQTSPGIVDGTIRFQIEGLDAPANLGGVIPGTGQADYGLGVCFQPGSDVQNPPTTWLFYNSGGRLNYMTRPLDDSDASQDWTSQWSTPPSMVENMGRAMQGSPSPIVTEKGDVAVLWRDVPGNLYFSALDGSAPISVKNEQPLLTGEPCAVVRES